MISNNEFFFLHLFGLKTITLPVDNCLHNMVCSCTQWRKQKLVLQHATTTVTIALLILVFS